MKVDNEEKPIKDKKNKKSTNQIISQSSLALRFTAKSGVYPGEEERKHKGRYIRGI